MADAFDELGLPARFDLPAEAVERAYLAAVGVCHPDLESGGDDPEKEAEASRRAAALNRAKATLLNPESRARALLARLGSPGGDERELPGGFLGEILQTRMALEEAVAAGDASEVARLRAWADEQRAERLARVSRLFGRAGRGAEELREIRRELNAWRYIERMLEQVEHPA